MSNPYDADSPYREAMVGLPHVLEASYDRLMSQGPLPLDGTSVTRAVLLRMSAFYEMQKGIDKLIDKRVKTAAADFFVEAVAFFLRAALESCHADAQVSVERKLRPKPHSIRPDISVWRGDNCLACIECKTQLGWTRDRWEVDFLERERRLIEEFAGSSAFLLVLTDLNWPGFGKSSQVGVKYFHLLADAWPTNVDFDDLEGQIGTRIEDLFSRIVKLGQ